jgi:hypothetical protein
MIEVSVGLLITGLIGCFMVGGIVGVCIMCILREADND